MTNEEAEIMEMASIIADDFAFAIVSRNRREWDAREEVRSGDMEPWEFGAAENMMRPHEYFQGQVQKEAARIFAQVTKMDYPVLWTLSREILARQAEK